MRHILPWCRPVIPFLGMTMTLLCCWSYFSTFRKTIVLRQWCNCNTTDDTSCQSCRWDVVHTFCVVFFGANIIGHYLWCAFLSPGFVMKDEKDQGDSSSNNHVNRSGELDSEIEKIRETEMEFGGCCFVTSKINLKSERDRSSKYSRQCFDNSNEKELSGSETNPLVRIIYHPSPDTTECTKCHHQRPPRSHHCKVCKRCILEYDHHCPWVNNCIGYNNYREFILLLVYIISGAAYGCSLIGHDFFRMMWKRVQLHGFNLRGSVHGTGLLDLPLPWVLWREYRLNGKIDEDVVLRAAFPFMLAIATAMLCILVGHVKLIIAGYTTVEKLSCPDEDSIRENTTEDAVTFILKNTFDRGPKKNFQKIMGTSLVRLVIPLPFYPDPLLRQPYGQISKDR